jgi:hypothetical protein
MTLDRQILLDNCSSGEASASNFPLVGGEIPPLREGEVLVRKRYLSLDPCMRGRMNDAKSNADQRPTGQFMHGGTVGEVVESRDPRYKSGDEVAGLVAAGKLRPRESVAQGLASAPEAFPGMLKGRNFGKQLVRLI